MNSGRRRRTTVEELALIDGRPYLATNLAKAPEQALQDLFDAIQLAIVVHEDGEHATMTIKLPADRLPEITVAAERITDMPVPQDRQLRDRLSLWGCCACPR